MNLMNSYLTYGRITHVIYSWNAQTMVTMPKTWSVELEENWLSKWVLYCCDNIHDHSNLACSACALYNSENVSSTVTLQKEISI